MRRLLRLLDAALRRRQKIEAFCDDADCLFRIRLGRTARPLPAQSGRIPAGAPIVELHLWNEHLPALPPGGASLAWGTRVRRMLSASLRKLARHLRDAPELRAAEGVIGVMTFFPADDTPVHRLPAQLGFACAPYRSPFGRFRDFWESVHVRLMMWTFNGRSLHGRRASRPRRLVVWMPRDELLRRYASGGERIR